MDDENYRRGRVRFRKQRDLIRKLIKAGHTMLDVYRCIGPDLDMSYEQFTRHVHAHPDIAQHLTKRKERKKQEGRKQRLLRVSMDTIIHERTQHDNTLRHGEQPERTGFRHHKQRKGDAKIIFKGEKE